MFQPATRQFTRSNEPKRPPVRSATDACCGSFGELNRPTPCTTCFPYCTAFQVSVCADASNNTTLSCGKLAVQHRRDTSLLYTDLLSRLKFPRTTKFMLAVSLLTAQQQHPTLPRVGARPYTQAPPVHAGRTNPSPRIPTNTAELAYNGLQA